MLADAVNQDAIVTDRGQAGLPTLFAETLFGPEVKVVVGFQGRQGPEDLAGDVQYRLAVLLPGREDFEGVVIEAEDGIILGLGPADIAREIIGAMNRAQPLFPLGQRCVQHRLKDRFLTNGHSRCTQ